MNNGRSGGFYNPYQQQNMPQQNMQQTMQRQNMQQAMQQGRLGVQYGPGSFGQFGPQQQQGMNNGYINRGGNNRGGPTQRMGSNGRPLRQNTASAFGKPPQRENGMSSGVNPILYRRFQNQVMGNNMMFFEGTDMDFRYGGPMDFGMGYGGEMMGPQMGGYGGPWNRNGMDRRQ